MKKIFLIFSLIIMSLASNAAEYSYLAIQKTDGTSIVVKSDGLRFFVKDGTLTIAHENEKQTLNLAELTSMRFATESSGIESLVIGSDIAVEIYSISGAHIGSYDNFNEAITRINTRGIYLFKTERGTAKIHIQ